MLVLRHGVEGDVSLAVLRLEDILAVEIISRSCMELAEVLQHCGHGRRGLLRAVAHVHLLLHLLHAFCHPVGGIVCIAKLIFLVAVEEQ